MDSVEEEFKRALNSDNTAKLDSVLKAFPNLANSIVSVHHGWVPLHVAALHGHIETARLLIQHGADPNAQDDSQRSPVYMAAIHGFVQLVHLLAHSGAGLNTFDVNHHTPLHAASECGHTDVVRLLIENGAQVNTKDWLGRTPVYDASCAGYSEIVRLLVSKGAWTNVKNEFGLNAREIAVKKHHTNVILVLDQEIRRRLRTFFMGTLRREERNTKHNNNNIDNMDKNANGNQNSNNTDSDNQQTTHKDHSPHTAIGSNHKKCIVLELPLDVIEMIARYTVQI
eukprot:c15251_g1_i1.p1 GENE.c15251_g1_i1~~c15251_g1_i1.p1  ORF type:complete len:283 (-),score=72.98 c15251_g1_i1:78-926(-)